MKSVPTKQDLKLDITELELAAEMVEKEEEEKWKMQALNMTLELHLSDEEESRYEYQTPMWTWILCVLYMSVILVRCHIFSGHDLAKFSV